MFWEFATLLATTDKYYGSKIITSLSWSWLWEFLTSSVMMFDLLIQKLFCKIVSSNYTKNLL